MNSCTIHWRKFTLLLSTAIIRKIISPMMSEVRGNAIIIDDSLLSRNRSTPASLHQIHEF